MLDIEARVLIGWYSLASQSERVLMRFFMLRWPTFRTASIVILEKIALFLHVQVRYHICLVTSAFVTLTQIICRVHSIFTFFAKFNKSEFWELICDIILGHTIVNQIQRHLGMP